MVFNATFNNISVISWWSVLFLDEGYSRNGSCGTKLDIYCFMFVVKLCLYFCAIFGLTSRCIDMKLILHNTGYRYFFWKKLFPWHYVLPKRYQYWNYFFYSMKYSSILSENWISHAKIRIWKKNMKH